MGPIIVVTYNSWYLYPSIKVSLFPYPSSILKIGLFVVFIKHSVFWKPLIKPGHKEHVAFTSLTFLLV